MTQLPNMPAILMTFSTDTSFMCHIFSLVSRHFSCSTTVDFWMFVFAYFQLYFKNRRSRLPVRPATWALPIKKMSWTHGTVSLEETKQSTPHPSYNVLVTVFGTVVGTVLWTVVGTVVGTILGTVVGTDLGTDLGTVQLWTFYSCGPSTARTSWRMVTKKGTSYISDVSALQAFLEILDMNY